MQEKSFPNLRESEQVEKRVEEVILGTYPSMKTADFILV
jgi:hypothetical protein